MPTFQKSRLRHAAENGKELPAPFPNGALTEGLEEAMQSSGVDFKACRMDIISAILWVPTVDGEVIPLSALIAKLPNQKAR